MSDFNLFSVDKTKEIAEKSRFSLSSGNLAFFILLGVFVFIFIVAFGINFYYESQLNDKGNTLISLKQKQDSYNKVINDINASVSRDSAKTDILEKRILTEDILKDIDTATNSTVTRYSINTETGAISIDGKTTEADGGVKVSESLGENKKFSVIRLNNIQKNDNNYSYNISFQLNSEKVQP